MPVIRRRLESSAIGRALDLLPVRQRRKLLLLVLVQMLLGSLDLLAVGLVGVLGTLAIAGMQSSESAGTVRGVLEFLQLQDLPPQAQVGTLGVAVGVIFLGRTAASIYLIRRALHFLGVRAAEASNDLIARLFDQPLTFLQTRSSQEFIYSVTTSANSLVLGVLGAVVIMAADAFMLVALAILLFIASPIVAVMAGVLMLGLVMVLQRLTAGRAHDLGVEIAELDIQGRDMMMEALSTFRDMRVKGSQARYVGMLRSIRLQAAAANAEWTFLPNISKYVLESAVILAALVIGAVQFAISDAQTAVGTLAIFLAAGTRLAPAIMRLQQGSIALKGSAGQGAAAAQLLGELPVPANHDGLGIRFQEEHLGFEPQISACNASYTYPGSATPAVHDFSIDIAPGQLIALVGPSGAGKSTAADLLLGVLKPQSGRVLISSASADEALDRWPGALGYVPQDVWIAEGTVRKNVTLGFDIDQVPDESVWRSLEIAQLDDVVRSLTNQLDAQVGERGAKLSGGQRQRLGIARALVTSPKLVVLDEATSALDADTEHKVSLALDRMRGSVTLVVVAHRLAVVRDADLVVYMEDGYVVARGSFQEVREAVPNFDRQASLLGL